MEVFYNGRWGTICHYSWDIWDARVVCRQLGYANAIRALRGYRPHGTGQIWLSYVGCTGNEENLISCSHNGWGNHNCGHYEDAGVECSGKGKIIIFFLTTGTKLCRSVTSCSHAFWYSNAIYSTKLHCILYNTLLLYMGEHQT